MTKSLGTCLALLLFVVSGCLCSSAEPRDPHWQKEACSQCRMAVGDPAFAAQIVGPGMAWRHYDDLGCALKDLAGKPDLQAGTLYVHVPSEHGLWRWAPAADVLYAEGLQSPMGHGFAPSPTGKLTIDDVRARLRQQPPGGMP